MQKKKLIRYVESLVLLPVLSVSMPTVGPIQVPTNSMNTYPQIVLSTQQNIEVPGLLTFNQAKEPAPDPKQATLKLEAENIDAYFKSYDMPLEGAGMKMAIEADKNGLDYRLLPAIAVRESTGGKFPCQRYSYNAFGWGSCHFGFKSQDQEIETIARSLSGNDPEMASYYAGKNVKQILQTYNPPSVVANYADEVMSIMNNIGPAYVQVGSNKVTA